MTSVSACLSKTSLDVLSVSVLLLKLIDLDDRVSLLVSAISGADSIISSNQKAIHKMILATVSVVILNDMIVSALIKNYLIYGFISSLLS